jgi:hypothetical protein
LSSRWLDRSAWLRKARVTGPSSARAAAGTNMLAAINEIKNLRITRNSTSNATS